MVPIPIPIPIPASIGSIIDMTRWAITVTPSRMQFFHWISFFFIKGLCLITNLLFWLFACMFLKTLPTWNGLLPFISVLWRLRPWWLGGSNNNIQDIWPELFPDIEIQNSISLQIILHETGHVGANILNSLAFPLLVGNPVFWVCAMLIMFVFHNALSFIYRCLELADRGRADTERHLS
jgi:hypothetical protein